MLVLLYKHSDDQVSLEDDFRPPPCGSKSPVKRMAAPMVHEYREMLDWNELRGDRP